MAKIRQLSRLLKYAGLGGASVVAGGVMMNSSGTSDSGMLASLASPAALSLRAQSQSAVSVSSGNKSAVWDSNWDKR